MSAEIKHLPIDPSRPTIEHRTLSVAAFARLLAQAEELGYRRALNDANVPAKEANRLKTNHEALYGARVDLYAAIWRRAGKGI